VDGGTRPNTAVYNKEADVPAGVDVAGALSAYGTMGQGGNVWEWTETAANGANNVPSERRVIRGGGWDSEEDVLRSSFRAYEKPSSDRDEYGFRVASIPEPSTFALLLLGASAIYLYAWLKRAR
jgi:formylglycine-generating enzyme required for sulfatase activity